MKKFFAMVCAALTSVILALVFTACDFGSSNTRTENNEAETNAPSIVGIYKFESCLYTFDFDRANDELKIGDDYCGLLVTEDLMVLEIREDGTLTLTTNNTKNNTIEYISNGTWKKDDGVYILTVIGGIGMSGEEQIATLDGNKLTLKCSYESYNNKNNYHTQYVFNKK
ncbi:MAG: hypothetical protein ACI4L9_02110 [Candidatus Coproplasma sp.]